MMGFYVYILVSELDGSFYIGQTNNVEARLERHNAGHEKYTSKKRPWQIFWFIKVATRSEAMKLERKIKNFKSRQRIIDFVERHKAGS